MTRPMVRAMARPMMRGMVGVGASGPLTAMSLTVVAQPLFQRAAGGTTYDLTIAGSTVGQASAIEARILLAADDSTVVDWTTIDASPGASSFSGTLTVPQGGPYYTEVRDVAHTGIGDTEATQFSVGIIIVALGQSNMVNMFDTSSGAPSAAAGTFYHNGSAWAAVPNGNGVRTLLNGVRSATGLPVGIINTAIGGTGSEYFAPPSGKGWAGDPAHDPPIQGISSRVTAVGNDAEFCILRQGEGDADGNVGSPDDKRAAWKSNWLALHSALAAQIGRTTAQIPLIVGSLATYGGDQATISDADWWSIQQGIIELSAENADVYYSHSAMDAAKVDSFHYTAASYGKLGDRFAQSIAVLIGDESDDPAWFIAGATQVDATHTDVTVAHSLGTDFTPTSGITGFTLSTDNWATTVTPSAAVQQDATTIRLTHSDLGTADDRAVRYQYGTAPDVSAPVFDNSSLAAPLNFSAGQMLIADGTGTLPVPTFVVAKRSTANGTPVETYSAINLGVGTTTEDLMVIHLVFGGGTVSSTALTPNGGSPIAGTIVTQITSNEPVSLATFIIPASTSGCDNLVITQTYTANRGATDIGFIWTVPVADLQSTTPVDTDTSYATAVTSRTLGLSSEDGGFLVAATFVNEGTAGQSCAWTGDGTLNERNDTTFNSGTFYSCADAVGTPDATNDNDVTATVQHSGNMRLFAASWR